MQKQPLRTAANDIISELKAIGASLAVVPETAAVDWERVAVNPSIPMIITNRPSLALSLCLRGQPAIAVLGVSEGAVAKWLRHRGSNVKDKKSAH